MIVDDKTRAAAIAYADAMVAWLESDEDFPPRCPSIPAFDLARYGAERAIDELTVYSLEIEVRWPAIAAMLRLGWSPGDPVPAEIIARWEP